MNEEQMKAELARLTAENEALRLKKTRPVTFRVGTKGALSMYGMGRFPVTLYKGQWQTLLENVPAIQAALKEHDAKLKTKED